MNRFPEKYVKPELISLDEGMNRGWSAACEFGDGAATVAGCTFGHQPGKSSGNNDGFIDPEILQQGL
ncbi:MAG: hypothetical protein KAT47_03630 [Candidatus Aegiribacteria sp.]|nr:hypothetical protein [Candidatus Aegiribacteria sp.]